MSEEQGVFKLGPAKTCLQQPICDVNVSRVTKIKGRRGGDWRRQKGYSVFRQISVFESEVALLALAP
jgi:hypothetical protein